MASLFPRIPLSGALVTPSAVLLGTVDSPPGVGVCLCADEFLAFGGDCSRDTADDDIVLKDLGVVVLPWSQATPLGLLHFGRGEAIAFVLAHDGDRPGSIVVTGRRGGGPLLEEVEDGLLEG